MLWEQADYEEEVINGLRNQLPSSLYLQSSQRKQKKKYPSFRKLYYEDPQCNPQFHSQSTTLEYGEDTNELSSTHLGYTWAKEKRCLAQSELEIGPKKSVEYPHLFEKPITHFIRNRQRITFHGLAPKPTSHKSVSPPAHASPLVKRSA
jgi:hypothetical protein